MQRGVALPGVHVVLKDAKGSRVPLQTKVLARWPDGSAKWVLLDFAAAPPPNGESALRLTWSRSAKRVQPSAPLRVRRGAAPALISELVKVEPSAEGVFRLDGAFDVALRMTDSRGRIHSGVVSAARVETAGPLRSAIVFEGDFKDRSGRRAFSFRFRVTAFAGMSLVRVEPMIIVDADKGVLQPIRELRLDVRSIRSGRASGKIGGTPGWKGSLTESRSVRLFQVDDRQYRLEGGRGRGKRAPGWAEFSTGATKVAVCVRDFWQQWPKSIELTCQGVSVGLLPRFKPGAFDHMRPWHKYGYLFNGSCYQLKTGQARRWAIWLDVSRSGASLSRLANAEAAPVADPKRALATGVWGGVKPAGRAEARTYDAWADALCDAFIESVDISRDYGAMNWGDWWGERRINWGNNEYDTGNLLLIAFARTGNVRYFRAGEAAARHMAEVDILHAVNPDLVASFSRRPDLPIRPGCMHEHCVGHVGGFCSPERIRRLLVRTGVQRGNRKPHLCLEPRNLGHVWTEGMTRLYFLTGDTWVRESAELVADQLARTVEEGRYAFMRHSHSGRTTGWPLIALAAAYELGRSRRYRRAMKKLVDGALDDQDPNCGGWIYRLVPGHCWCVKEKHVGMCTFLTAILINALTRYYDVSGDPRVPEAVHRATVHMNNDAWHDEAACWRVSSCPAMPISEDSGLVILAMANSIRLAPDAEHLRILRKAFRAKLAVMPTADSFPQPFGKEFSMAILGTAEGAAGL